MTLKFTKMHGLGNDFMVIDGIQQSVHLTPNMIQKLSDRHTGIGFDQCLIIESSNRPNIDFFYRIYNANGDMVGQCGNGARCIAKFIEHYQLSDKKTFTVATSTTEMTLQLNPDNSVTVDMGTPQFKPQAIPFKADETTQPYIIEKQKIYVVNIGNPHAIMLVDDLTNAPVATLGKTISEHSQFPEQTNVSFLLQESNSHIRLRVYERGCGETQACGSAAVAATAVGLKFLNLQSPVKVSLPGGDLSVSWPNQQTSIDLTGPATFVYEADLIMPIKPI